MSGSGSSDFSSTGNSRVGGGISSSDASDTNCSSFVFETTIGSPRINVINTLNVGDLLNISLTVNGGVQVVVLETQSSHVAGGLSPSQEVEFIKVCIDLQGTQYVGQVLSISGSLVRIRVQSV